ncbi:MAG: insulinase family protein [Desulfovibrionaceae bacterium]|nr:insulinase family protein [Desulfovibrionaceae bacterium]
MIPVVAGAADRAPQPDAATVHAAQAAAAPTVTRLPNGLTVLIQRDTRFPLASLRLYVGTGSAYETPKEAGISHLLEHMVFKGTEKRPGGGAAEAIESVGGYINAATSFDYTVFITDVPAASWSLGMDVLQDMAFHATVEPQALENEKKVVLAELERGEDNPSAKLFKTIQSMVWKGTTYERPIIGYHDTVSAVTSQDLHDYVARHYQPQNALLVVCGDVPQADVLAEARRLFGNLRNDRDLTPPLPVTPERSTGAQVSVRRGAYNKVYFSAALPAPSFVSDRSVPLEVLAHVLGGDKSSRLYRKFKYTEGLVDDISASDMTLQRTGMLYIDATLKPENLDTFWKELCAELAATDPATFTNQEIDRAKLNLEDSLFRAKETLSGLASKLGFFQFFLHSPLAEQNYLTVLRGVDRAQLASLAREVLRPENLCVAALLPDAAGPSATAEATASGDKADATAKDATIDDAATADALRAALAEQWPAKAAGTAQAAGPEAVGATETVDLGHGRTLVLLPDTTLPYTSVDMTFTGGDALLTPAQQGLAELAARLLTRGAGERSATEIQDFLADRASALSASAGRETFTVSTRFPTRFGADALALFRETLKRPAFPAEELAREKDSQIASIRAREDQPLGLAFRNLFPFLYRKSSYAYFHRGDPDALAGFTQRQVRDFWRAQQTQPWVMAVCGDFDRDAILTLARGLAAEGDGVAKAAVPAAPAWSAQHEKSLVLKDRNQTHLLMIFPAVGQNDADTPGLELLRTILAGQGGLLFRDLRDGQGLGYTVTALLWQGRSAGLAAFYIGTYPEKEQQALAGFREAARRLAAEPLSGDDIQRGINTLVGDYYRDHQSLASRSGEAANLLARGFPLDWHKDLLAKVRTLTPKDLQRLAAKYFNPDKAYILRVAPR